MAKSPLGYTFDRDKFDEKDADPGINFAVEHDTNGKKIVVVASVLKPRELVYQDKNTRITCTHLIVPGMVVERFQGRPLTAISIELSMVAKHL